MSTLVQLPASTEILDTTHAAIVDGDVRSAWAAAHLITRAARVLADRRLDACQRRLEAAFTTEVIVERWSLRSFMAVTRGCKLYDYDEHRWHPFPS